MGSKKEIVICWFRQDLRVADNPALTKSLNAGNALPIYILDDVNSKEHAMGQASRWWLHHSLSSLYNKLNGKLCVYKGDPKEVFDQLANRFIIKEIFWNRCYEPWRIKRDIDLKIYLEAQAIRINTFNGSLLWEPWTVKKPDGTPYKVFTPFYKRGCLSAVPPRTPLGEPDLKNVIGEQVNDDNIERLSLLPKIHWYKTMDALWKPGEDGATFKLKSFLECGLAGYKEGRNFPSKENVSQLSPHLHFGELSPNQVWYAASDSIGSTGSQSDLIHFHSELGWREFSYSLLYYFPELPKTNLQSKFDRFPWKSDDALLDKWRKGLTGYPIVDAGMRELWTTGYMHNRVRMIVASFLVKNLLLHWHSGERWFWDCLIDADLASNSASWQWVAGSGADAAPYFRIFNPISQGERFDPEGEYTKQYVPELKGLPKKFLFNPWEAPKEVLDSANITLGEDYPYPIVELKQSREKALEAFSVIRVSKPP
jgi:deoxyribodipyrimidine photo-lyase